MTIFILYKCDLVGYIYLYICSFLKNDLLYTRNYSNG